jgi:hypothetical protein
MGHTPDQRDRHDLCGARKKNGDICRAFAGQGTDHPGYGRCKFHTGSTPNQKKHAIKLEAQRRMVTLGEPIEGLTAPDALFGLLAATAGHVAWLHSEVKRLDNLGEHEAQVVIRLYDSERDRLARIGEACIRAGIAETQVRVMQAQLELLGRALVNAASAIGLSESQRRALGRALREELAQSEAKIVKQQSLFAA